MNRETIGPISPQEKMAEAQIELAQNNDPAGDVSPSPKKPAKKKPAKASSDD